MLKRVVAEDLVLVSTSGSDWLLGTGTATKVDGGYKVTGRQIFCSGAPAGGLKMTTAVVDDPAEGPTVLQIVVPTTANGVKVENNWKALGMRGTGSHDISFDDVFVPDVAVALRRPSGNRAILGRGARTTVDKAMDLVGGGSFLRDPVNASVLSKKQSLLCVRCRTAKAWLSANTRGIWC